MRYYYLTVKIKPILYTVIGLVIVAVFCTAFRTVTEHLDAREISAWKLQYVHKE